MKRQLTTINIGFYTAFKGRIKYAENVKEKYFSGFGLGPFPSQLPTGKFEILFATQGFRARSMRRCDLE
jgi:hypothetical protein